MLIQRLGYSETNAPVPETGGIPEAERGSAGASVHPPPRLTLELQFPTSHTLPSVGAPRSSPPAQCTPTPTPLSNRHPFPERDLVCPRRKRLRNSHAMYRALGSTSFTFRRWRPHHERTCRITTIKGQSPQSRMLSPGPFFPPRDRSRQQAYAENTTAFLPVFKHAIARRGLPARLYIDNGANFRSQQLALVCAKLGIALIHARPYQSAGKGKIERWFRTVRAAWLRHLTAQATTGLDTPNRTLWAWVDRSASNDVVTSIIRSDCYRLERQFAGRDSHPLRDGAFPRHTVRIQERI